MPDTSDSDGDLEDSPRNSKDKSKRKRITQACDACNKKKVKCDGGKPTCGHCSRIGQACSYSRGAKKRGPRAGYIETLENRLKEMELLLSARQISMGESIASSDDADIAAARLTALRRRQTSSTPTTSGSGMTDFDGKHPGFGIDDASPPISSADFGADVSSSSPVLPQEVLDDLITLFYEYCDPFFPLLNQRNFRKKIQTHSPLLLNAIYALSARFSTHPLVLTKPDQPFASGDVFYMRARELVDHYMDSPSQSTVTALVLLATYAAGSGRGSAAWMYSGMAIRMAQELKLNVEPEFEESSSNRHRSDSLEMEERRRLWWCCYILDRYAGAAADRSMIINEKDCRVYLPCPEDVFQALGDDEEAEQREQPTATAAAFTHNDSFQIAVLTSTNMFTPGMPHQNSTGYYILLTKIFGKIVEYSNQHKSLSPRRGHQQVTDGHRAQAVAQGRSFPGPLDADYQLSVLDASLRDWMSSLPDYIRIVDDQFTVNHNPDSSAAWIPPYLHIYYHTCVILLHRPKMMGLICDTPEQVRYSSCFKACRSAASEICNLIEKVMKSNPNWNYICPFVAFCIFQSGLIHVMSAQMVEDDSSSISRSKVEIHVRALGAIARYWFMAGRLHSVLASLIDTMRPDVSATRLSARSEIIVPTQAPPVTATSHSFMNTAVLPYNSTMDGELARPEPAEPSRMVMETTSPGVAVVGGVPSWGPFRDKFLASAMIGDASAGIPMAGGLQHQHSNLRGIPPLSSFVLHPPSTHTGTGSIGTPLSMNGENWASFNGLGSGWKGY
ncbi:fungal-specific transcription factor domain-containing protein [Cladochytrium replicatum]|nr:fungal-specific transcription factor domain-containing protein [Cladochytrium replicatum]